MRHVVEAVGSFFLGVTVRRETSSGELPPTRMKHRQTRKEKHVPPWTRSTIPQRYTGSHARGRREQLRQAVKRWFCAAALPRLAFISTMYGFIRRAPRGTSRIGGIHGLSYE